MNDQDYLPNDDDFFDDIPSGDDDGDISDEALLQLLQSVNHQPKNDDGSEDDADDEDIDLSQMKLARPKFTRSEPKLVIDDPKETAKPDEDAPEEPEAAFEELLDVLDDEPDGDDAKAAENQSDETPTETSGAAIEALFDVLQNDNGDDTEPDETLRPIDATAETEELLDGTAENENDSAAEPEKQSDENGADASTPEIEELFDVLDNVLQNDNGDDTEPDETLRPIDATAETEELLDGTAENENDSAAEPEKQSDESGAEASPSEIEELLDELDDPVEEEASTTDTESVNTVETAVTQAPEASPAAAPLFTLEDTPAEQPVVYQYRVVGVLPSEISIPINNLRVDAGLSPTPQGLLTLQSNFLCGDIDALRTALQAWASEYLPLEITNERVDALVVDARRYIAAWWLEPEDDLLAAGEAMQSKIAALITEQGNNGLPFSNRLPIADHVPATRYLQLLHKMQIEFDFLQWQLDAIEILQAPLGDERWEVLATFPEETV